MIRAVIVINNHGKARLLKFYEKMTIEEQQQAVRELFMIVSKRSDHVCNFVEGGATIWGEDAKIIYRHYATLFIIFVVDANESELGILDLIQVFVEALDKSFENVCELDIIFHAEKIHYIIDEIIMGGMVLETNLKEITLAVTSMNKFEKSTEELSFSNTGTAILNAAGLKK